MVEISAIAFFNPIFAFALILVILYAILAKTKVLGGSAGVNIVVSIVIAIIFVSISSTREYIIKVVPWFVVLFVVVFFILLIIGFTQEKISSVMGPGFTWVFIIIFFIILVVVASNVFSSSFAPYYLGADESGGNPVLLRLKHVLLSPEILGALLLLAVAAVAAWVLTKK